MTRREMGCLTVKKMVLRVGGFSMGSGGGASREARQGGLGEVPAATAD